MVFWEGDRLIGWCSRQEADRNLFSLCIFGVGGLFLSAMAWKIVVFLNSIFVS